MNLRLADETKARAILYGVKRASIQMQVSPATIYQRILRAGLSIKLKAGK